MKSGYVPLDTIGLEVVEGEIEEYKMTGTGGCLGVWSEARGPGYMS